MSTMKCNLTDCEHVLNPTDFYQFMRLDISGDVIANPFFFHSIQCVQKFVESLVALTK